MTFTEYLPPMLCALGTSPLAWFTDQKTKTLGEGRIKPVSGAQGSPRTAFPTALPSVWESFSLFSPRGH